jgi:hypothetical protein
VSSGSHRQQQQQQHHRFRNEELWDQLLACTRIPAGAATAHVASVTFTCSATVLWAKKAW